MVYKELYCSQLKLGIQGNFNSNVQQINRKINYNFQNGRCRTSTFPPDRIIPTFLL